MEEEKFIAGLAGVNAGISGICTVGKQGHGLMYMGYDIKDLATNGTFEEIAHLLIHGSLPTTTELKAYTEKLNKLREINGVLTDILEEIPASAHPMDVMRTACSALGTIEPEEEGRDQYFIADRLIAAFSSVILYWHHWHKSGKRIKTEARSGDTTASYFLRLLHESEPDELMVKTLDISLILYAEHEFAASTFAARITASTLADFYSCVTTAIGTLRGPLHGGANEAAMHLLSKFNDPDQAEKGILDMLTNKQLIMGFGHRVYKKEDPRSPIIKEFSRKLSQSERGNKKLFSVSERVEQVMAREKKMFTNLDFYSASAYAQCGIPTSYFTPVFVVSRTTGWAAHIIEQRKNNRLIRPGCIYNGPQLQPYKKISERTSQDSTKSKL